MGAIRPEELDKMRALVRQLADGAFGFGGPFLHPGDSPRPRKSSHSRARWGVYTSHSDEGDYDVA